MKVKINDDGTADITGIDISNISDGEETWEDIEFRTLTINHITPRTQKKRAKTAKKFDLIADDFDVFISTITMGCAGGIEIESCEFPQRAEYAGHSKFLG